MKSIASLMLLGILFASAGVQAATTADRVVCSFFKMDRPTTKTIASMYFKKETQVTNGRVAIAHELEFSYAGEATLLYVKEHVNSGISNVIVQSSQGTALHLNLSLLNPIAFANGETTRPLLATYSNDVGVMCREMSLKSVNAMFPEAIEVN